MPGTLVLMADGSTKRIDKIKIGDKVKAGTVSEANSSQTVGTTIKGTGDKKLVTLTIDTDGGKGHKTAKIVATAGHPFWVPALQDWIDAGDLKPQDWLRTSAGTLVMVSATKAWTKRTTVHNLSVTTVHTYYVLADTTPVLVHNCGNTPPGVTCNYRPGTGAGPADAPIRAMGP